VRYGLCSDLGFSKADRKENIRRISEVAKLFIECGVITLTAFISPFIKDRNQARKTITDSDFIEVYVKCPVSVCEDRDVKGMYKKAKTNKINNFTGISSPYEEPISPDLIVNTNKETLDESTNKVIGILIERGIIKLTSDKQ
jgi:adenylylsulfate kinase